MKLLPKGSLRTAILIALAICVHATICLSLHYHFLNPLFYISTHAKGQGGCFFGIYQAGANLLSGESIYGCETYRTPKELAVPFYHFYRYLPFTSYIASVFAKTMKPWTAYWLWIVINEIMLAACILLTVRLRRRFGAAAIIAASFWLLFSPIYAELYMGQFCFAMAFFIFLLIYPYLRGIPEFAAVGGNPGTSDGHGNPDPSHHMPTSAGALPGGCVHRATSPDPLPPHTIVRRSASKTDRNWIASLSWVLSVLLKSFTAIYTLTLFRIGKKKVAIAGLSAAVLTSVPYFLKHPQDLRWFLHLNFQPIPSYSVGGCLGFSSLLRDTSDRCQRSFKSEPFSVV